MSLHTEIRCKECGWEGHADWENPKMAYLLIPAILFFLLYTQFDFDIAISGESMVQTLILVFLILTMAVPLLHIVKTLFSNLKIKGDVPEKCPGCGSGDLKISGGVS